MTDSDQQFLSAEAITALQSELEELKTTGREKMVEQIRQARDLGDITDNAAYETAKQDQALLEGRIARLEELVKNAVVREGKVESDVVTAGIVVTVYPEFCRPAAVIALETALLTSLFVAVGVIAARAPSRAAPCTVFFTKKKYPNSTHPNDNASTTGSVNATSSTALPLRRR